MTPPLPHPPKNCLRSLTARFVPPTCRLSYIFLQNQCPTFDMLIMIFVSRPVFSTSPTTHRVFLNTHPLSRSMSGAIGSEDGPCTINVSPRRNSCVPLRVVAPFCSISIPPASPSLSARAASRSPPPTDAASMESGRWGAGSCRQTFL